MRFKSERVKFVEMDDTLLNQANSYMSPSSPTLDNTPSPSGGYNPFEGASGFE